MNFNGKKSAKNIVISLSLVFLFSTAVLSCGSTKKIENIQSQEAESFTRKELSNGIPVIFKQNKGSKIVVFSLVFEGGASAIDKSLGGIEGLTFDMILRGSKNYPYDKISQLQYEKSFSISSSCGKDYSTLGFICIQRDLSQVMEIFTDCLLNPSMLESDYNQKISEIKEAISGRKTSPSGSLSLSLSENLYKGHPYETSLSVTEKSLPNISLKMVKGIYSSLLNASRIKIVITGNFSNDLMDDFVKSLNSGIGGISRSAFTKPVIPKISVSGPALYIGNEEAGDTGYIAAAFDCPSRYDSDYIPFALATMYLDDILYDQVREKAGAVYSVNSGVSAGKQFFAVISLYKVSQKEKLQKIVFDAIQSFNPEETNKILEQHKNRYISMIYSSSQTASGLTSSIVSSLEYYDNEKAYLERAEMIKNVSAEEVNAAYNKYILPVAKENAARWFIVDGEKNLKDYTF